MRIEDIQKGDTVNLVAERGIRTIGYTGTAYSDYKADCPNPGVALTMPSGKMYFLKQNKYGLKLTSWKGTSICNVAEYGVFV